MTDNDLSKDTKNETKREVIAYLSNDKASRLADLLKYSGITDTLIEYDKISDTYNLSVSSKDYEKAQNLYDVFAKNELDQTEADDNSNISDVVLYESSTEKYKDNLSSAITFFICGTAGLIILLLNDFGVLKLLTKDSSSFILMNIILAALFIGFLVIGFVSLKYSKKLKSTASNENKALKEVTDWLDKNLTIDEIEKSYDNSIPEEMKYFNRSEYIKEKIKKQFSEIDETTIDYINDQFIEKHF